MKLLCAADLHLGRRPSRLHDQITDDALLAAALTPEAAWSALVDLALAERVHAVLLAGDLLDDENDFYVTFGDLQAGVERLIAGGVSVLAVSGNHDVTVLARLARVVPALRLLGEGGVWEVATLADVAATVHVVGWSYPSGAVTYSPVGQVAEALSGLAPARVVGLLHCDRDQPNSRYAPVSSSELAAAPVDAWVLGHVHKPDFGASSGQEGSQRLSGYLGSLSAADPGEEGPRGA
ncbi:MAG TPA: metallophosphoesterase, partial [Trueperaceae bacterium]|nr:metallophosphoesterase [Trueperaceae bacterium]